jgi:hypothetical protein
MLKKTCKKICSFCVLCIYTSSSEELTSSECQGLVAFALPLRIQDKIGSESKSRQ